MESNRKRRGSSSFKGKLVMSFYRSPPKPTTTTMSYNTSKVIPSPPPSTTSVGYLVDQEFLVPSANKKVSFVKTEGGGRDKKVSGGRESKTHVEYNTYGGGDELVDVKAASYISYVQERFRLERVESERRSFQEVQY